MDQLLLPYRRNIISLTVVLNCKIKSRNLLCLTLWTLANTRWRWSPTPSLTPSSTLSSSQLACRTSPHLLPVISNLIIDTDGIKLKISTEVLVEESLSPTVGQSDFAWTLREGMSNIRPPKKSRTGDPHRCKKWNASPNTTYSTATANELNSGQTFHVTNPTRGGAKYNTPRVIIPQLYR